MNKFKTIILITIAIFALTSCGTVKNELGFGDKAGLTYNKLSVSEKDIDADLKQLETNKTFTDQFSDPSQPFLVKGKLSPDIKATWVNIQLHIKKDVVFVTIIQRLLVKATLSLFTLKCL